MGDLIFGDFTQAFPLADFLPSIFPREKSDMANVGGKDDVPPMASVEKAREPAVRPQNTFTGEGKGWRKRRFVASPVSSWPKREQAALIKAWVEVTLPEACCESP